VIAPSFHCNNQAPCRHVLSRQSTMTSQSLSRLSSILGTTNNTANEPSQDQNPFSLQPHLLHAKDQELHDSDDCEYEVRPLNNRGTYKLTLSVVLNIASLASNHGTTQFEAYLNSMKMGEDFMRASKFARYGTFEYVFL